MANYVKFKQGLKKDFNTTNQPLTNGMIYFVIDENNHGSIYYDTIVDGKKATKNGTVHRVKFSGLPIKITGSVIGTGVISQDGETIEINTSTNHSHGLAHQDFTVTLSDDNTNLKWTRLGNQNGGGFWLKSIRGQAKAPAWFLPDYSAGIAFGGADTKGIISVRYSQPGVRFAGGNGDAPVWYFTITGANDKTYDLSKIGGHSSDSAKLDHNVTFKIASTADATKGGSGTATNLSGSAVDLYLPTKISGFDLLQATRFQGNADTSTVAAKLGRGGNTSLPMTFNWSGQGGQPTWLWGGENGTDMYVYNPSNFKVAHSVSTAGLDHDVTFKISKVANATTGETGVVTKLTGALLELILPASISGFNLIQSTRFQGNADSATVASRANSLFLNPSNRQENINYQINSDQYQSRVTYSLASSITKTGKPPIGDSHVLTFGWDWSGWGAQLAITADAKPHIAIRGAKASKNGVSIWDETWSTVLDSSNYTSYINNYYWADVKVSTTANAKTNPNFFNVTSSGWFFSNAPSTGWQNSAHGGGIYMKDSSYVRIYGGKKFAVENTDSDSINTTGGVKASGGFTSDSGTMKVYAEVNNEINFGGTNGSNTVYFGYRKKDSKEIPSIFIFGSDTGTANIQANAGWFQYTNIGYNYSSNDSAYRLRVNGASYIDGNLTIPNKSCFTGILGSNSSTNSGDVGGLTWFNIEGTAGAAVDTNDTPSSAWWYILRNRHTNQSNNYYTDVAIPFNDKSIYYKIVRGGGVVDSKWIKVLDVDNYTYTLDGRYVLKTGDTMTGNLRIKATDTSERFVDVYNSTGHIYLDATNGRMGIWTNIGGVSTWLISTTKSNAEIPRLLQISSNGNTITIGSQNSDWCHLYNSANIPFIFNKTVASTDGNLGTIGYPWHEVYSNSWFRSIGTGGWYSETYGGGWHMTDSTWLRSYNDKPIYTAGGIYSPHGHIFICAGNEFNFIPDSYNGAVWFNYQSWGRPTPGGATSSIITEYRLGNGRGGLVDRVYANTFVGSLSGTATNAEYVSNDNKYMRFHWNGQGGQPTWLWGGNEPGNMYVYNPSNFSVNYANSAGNADTTDGVHLEWSGSQAASATDWIAGWSADGKKIKAVKRSDLETKNADTVDGYHADAFVKKTGDTMTGDLNFREIGQWPAPSDETYPMNSAGIRWGGSSDYAKIYYEVAAADTGKLVFNTGDDSNCIISFRNCETQYAYIDTQGLHGAVWNDYAECRKSNENEPGRVVLEDNFGVCQITVKRLQPFAGVISDTYGFCQGETNDAKTPLAVAGRVLVYTYQNRYNYKIGDCVCAAPNGTIDIMTREEVREYPDRIVGTVSEIPDYEVWGTGNVKVNNRIWIKVK